MKPRYLLFVFPFLLFSIFSCKKSESPSVSVESIAPPDKISGTYDPLHPVNVRVTLSNTNWQPVFAAIQILPAGQVSAVPLQEIIINIHDVEVKPLTEVSFSLDPGTDYMVCVISNSGERYYGPNITASYDLITTSFNGQINAPGIITYDPSNPTIPPPTNPPTPDDSTSFPPVPGLTYPFTVVVPDFIGGSKPIEVQLWAASGGITPLQTRILLKHVIYENGSLGWRYDKEARFNLAQGVNFTISVRSEDGAQIHSISMTSAWNFPLYVF